MVPFSFSVGSRDKTSVPGIYDLAFKAPNSKGVDSAIDSVGLFYKE